MVYRDSYSRNTMMREVLKYDQDTVQKLGTKWANTQIDFKCVYGYIVASIYIC